MPHDAREPAARGASRTRSSALAARGWLGCAAALALAPLALVGCAKQIAEANLPAVPIPPEPPTATAVPRPPLPPAPPELPPAPAVPAPSRPAHSRPAPVVTAPPPPVWPGPSVPAPASPPSPPVPAPVLSAHVGGEEERRLTQAAQTRIEDAEKIVGRLDHRRLEPPHQETYSTIQSFLTKAREAIAAKDYQRAYTLADKAQILAEQLARAVR